MDDRLKKALNVANFMMTFSSQKELLKQEFKENCLYHESGHRFTINKELINFLSTLINLGYLEDVVILDDFENPYMISDAKEFLNKIFNIYVESSNKYYQLYSELKSKRSIEKVIDINE